MVKKNIRVNESMQSQHMPSQADTLDENNQQQFLSPPESTSRGGPRQPQEQQDDFGGGFSPQAANGLLGGNFGAMF